MPRYEGSYTSKTRLYVGNLSSRTSRDLEHIFSRYGRVRDVDMKRDYAFVELSGPRDADDARYNLDGINVDGRRISVEFSKGVQRGSAGARDHVGRGSAPGSGCCFNCGVDGHWSRDCKAGDWKNKCCRCGERGHIERNCRNRPKKLRPPRRGTHGSSCGGQSSSRSLRRGRNDRERHVEYEESRSRSPEQKRATSSSKREKHSPNNDIEREKGSHSPSDQSLIDKAYDESPYGGGYCDGPKKRSRSSVYKSYNESPFGEGYCDSPKERSRSPVYALYDESPYAANSHNLSPDSMSGKSPDAVQNERTSPYSPKERSRSPMCEESSYKGGYRDSAKKKHHSLLYKLYDESPYKEGYRDSAKERRRSPLYKLYDKSYDKRPYKERYRDNTKKRYRRFIRKLYNESPYEGEYHDSSKKRSRSPMYKWCDESPYTSNGSSRSPSLVDGKYV